MAGCGWMTAASRPYPWEAKQIAWCATACSPSQRVRELLRTPGGEQAVAHCPWASPSRTTDGIEIPGFAGEAVPPLVNLAAVHADPWPRLDAEPNALSLHGERRS